MASSSPALVLRKAKMSDVKRMHSMLLASASEGWLLARSLTQIYSHLRDFFVLDPGYGKPIVGCVALSITWDDIAEVRSLILSEDYRSLGLGRRLVDACIEEARDLGLHKVFTLTYQVDFFGKLGFNEVSKDTLPQKVWADCIHCPKFPECDETAMLFEC